MTGRSPDSRFNPLPGSDEDIVEWLKVGILKHVRDGAAQVVVANLSSAQLNVDKER